MCGELKLGYVFSHLICGSYQFLFQEGTFEVPETILL